MEVALKQTIDGYDHKAMFNTVWDLLDGRCRALRSLSVGLATSFANTISVESDISILKEEKNSNRRSLTNLALESIFSSKEHKRLTQIYL